MFNSSIPLEETHPLQFDNQSLLEVDLVAIDAIFKRLAERGRKVRNQAQIQAIADEAKDSKNTTHRKNKIGGQARHTSPADVESKIPP